MVDALDVTKSASNDYERAVRLQDWFASDGGFRYDTQVQSGSGTAAIVRFLRDKEGFCVHFSFSMAAMARTLGIPARVAVGFTPGTAQSDGSMSVGLRDAHAWPELYFEGVGWTRFEPTPSRGSAPEYTRQDTPSGSASDPAQAQPSTSAAPSAAPSATDSCPPQMRKLGECGGAAQQGGAGPTDTGIPVGRLVLLALAVVLVVLLPLLPLLWRSQVRTRRLGSVGRTPADVAARTLSGWREITDSAWDYGVAPDESQTPRKAAARICASAGSTVRRPMRCTGRQARWSRCSTPRGLRSRAISPRRPGRYGRVCGTRRDAGHACGLFAPPRSAVRVVWAVSARWAAVRGRWGASRWTVERWAGALRRRRPGSAADGTGRTGPDTSPDTSEG